MVAESPSGLSTADDPARIGNEFIGIVENTGSEVTVVKKATKFARKVFMLGSWALVAAPTRSAARAATGAWSLCPVAQAAANTD
jgi:hypothetical protein